MISKNLISNNIFFFGVILNKIIINIAIIGTIKSSKNNNKDGGPETLVAANRTNDIKIIVLFDPSVKPIQ